jgi:hypothetical protein
VFAFFLSTIFFSFLHLNLKQARTARPDTVVSGDPKNQCHFFCSTSQPLAQQSQTLFLYHILQRTSGRRKHCSFLFADLNMWNDLEFISTDVWYLNRP